MHYFSTIGMEKTRNSPRKMKRRRGLSPQRRGLSPSFFALPTIVDKLQDDAKKIGGDNSYQINIGV